MINLKYNVIKYCNSYIKDAIMRYSNNNINTKFNYEDAIKALNNLQSNADCLRNAPKHDAIINKNLDETKKYLVRSGITMEQLNELSIIHVAGTKGKGSTCAYIDRILREHGYKTGLYTSPHLVSVRERLMINGQVIDKENFTNYFSLIYERLINQRSYESDMPAYFKFITIMMFNIFIKASIDVAIIEVGIGGEYDCTNIINNPVAVGITKLDLDHMSLLGNNIKDIAYQKSGIFKCNVPAFTVPQSSNALSILFNRAIEKNCTLNIVPAISNYLFNINPPILGISANVQYYNASLAIQLSNVWIKSQTIVNNNNEIIQQLDMNKVEIALKNCKWPGRTQLLRGNLIDFYLDGAHTIESMRGCIDWFKTSTDNTNFKRVLIFNVLGNRDAVGFMSLLKLLNFNSAFFVPNLSGIDNIEQNDKLNTNDRQINGCEINCRYWGVNGYCASSVNHAFSMIKQKYQLNDCVDDNRRIQLLITGSLHLVGAALSILDPNLTMSTNF